MAINKQKNGSNGGQNDRDLVKNHERIHTDEKHKCQKCNKCFTFSWDLKSHEKTHKPYSCRTCHKKFELESQLKNHESIHSSRQKTFSCTKGDETFAHRSKLKKHERNHRDKVIPGENLFSCSSCEEKFVQKNSLKKHEKIHNNPPATSNEKCKKSQKILRVGHLNICKGVNSKEALLLNTIEDEEIDIIGVSETDLYDFNEQKPWTLKGFKTYWPLKRTEKNVKRMLCFVKEDIEVSERQDLMSPNISSIWLEYKTADGNKILICLTYREFNPCTGDKEIDVTSKYEQLVRLEELSQQVEKATKECSRVYILGDLNIDLKKWNDKDYYLKKIAEEYQTMMGINGTASHKAT